MGPGLPGYLGQEKERMVGRKPALLRVLSCCCGFCHAATGFVMLLPELFCVMAERK